MNHIVLDRFSEKKCKNKACISLHYCLCCLAQWILWLNKTWAISRLIFQAPATTPLSEWAWLPQSLGMPQMDPYSPGLRMYNAHPKIYRAAFIKCLALWAPKDCHLFSVFKRLSSLEEHCGMQASITLSFFGLASLSCGYAPCSCCPVSLTSFVSLLLITEPFSPPSVAEALSPLCTPAPQLVWAHPLVLGWCGMSYCQLVAKQEWGKRWAQETGQNTMNYHVGMAFPCYTGFCV